MCGIGDVDGDGVNDFAFGAPGAKGAFDAAACRCTPPPRDALTRRPPPFPLGADGPHKRAGRLYVAFPDEDGEVQRAEMIRSTDGRRATPTGQAHFGYSCAGLGDLDQDGVPDVAVGMPHKPGSPTTRGAVIVEFLSKQGGSRKSVRIAPEAQGCEKLPEDKVPEGANFGAAVAALGRFFEGDAKEGVSDLLVGAPGTSAGRGAVHLLGLSVDGRVKEHAMIGSGTKNFVDLPPGARFGAAATLLGDVNDDGVPDIAVGAPGEDDAGAVYVMFLTRAGGVKGYSKVMKGAENFEDVEPAPLFGSSVTALGDVDGNGVPDMLVGGPNENGDGGAQMGGAGFLIPLQSSGKPTKGVQRVAFPKSRGSMVEGFTSVAIVSRDNKTRVDHLLVGAPGMSSHYEGSRAVTGGVFTARLSFPAAAVRSMGDDELGTTLAVFPHMRHRGRVRDCKWGPWSEWSTCSAVCGIGYQHREREIVQTEQGDGRPCLSVVNEQSRTCDKGECTPATVVNFGAMASGGEGGFKDADRPVKKGDDLGAAVCSIGDVDGDENFDMGMGAPNGDGGRGHLYVVLLGDTFQGNRTVRIGAGAGGLQPESVSKGDRFGAACAGLGDMNQDGVPDVVVGAPGTANGHGSVHVLRMSASGRAGGSKRFSDESEEFPQILRRGSGAVGLGASVAPLGFLLGDDSIPDAAFGADQYDDGRGAVVLAQLKEDGSVAKAHAVIGGDHTHGFNARLQPQERFGAAIGFLGDVNGDGLGDLAVGSPGYDGRSGRVFVLLLNGKGSVHRFAEIQSSSPGFDLPLVGGSFFGAALTGAGDVDGDGVVDVAVGAPRSNARSRDAGALYVALLHRTGDVKEVRKTLPPKGRSRGARVYSSLAVVEFTPDNRTLVLAAGAPRLPGKAAEEGERGVRAGGVLLGHMAIEQKSDLVGKVAPFPTLHIPRDCVLTNWTEFTNCSEGCGGGVQFRTRSVLMQAEPGGRNCSQFEKEQERACNTQHCPIDCVVSEWTDWTNCTAECGGGFQRRNRSVQVYPDYGGAECGNVTERRECNTEQCPQACELSEWGAWSQCSQECGGGEQTRNRTVLTEPAFGAPPCSNVSETRDCNTQKCPIHCEVGEWSEWTMCNVTCGGGAQSRTREIKQRPRFGGDACPRLEEEQACNTQECPFDCKVSEWSGWSNCSEWCGTGMQERHRDILRYPAPKGAACPNVTEVRKCELRPCPADCEVGAWSAWSECSAECGPGGRRNRTRRIKTHPKHGGEKCPALVEEKDCFEKSCPVHCKVSQWGEWSACDPWCGKGRQHRKRTVLVQPDFGGDECPELKQRRECNEGPCPENCKVTEWEAAGGCSVRCGGGWRQQKRAIREPPKHRGKRCPPLKRHIRCNEYACADPVLKTDPCGDFESCGACVADDRCGWAPNAGRAGLCLRGTVRGPVPMWTMSPSYMRDPFREFLSRTNITEWAFAYCPETRCTGYQGCAACLADPQCGYCSTTQSCMDGATEGPTRGQFCPRGWMHAPALSANDTELAPAADEVRITKPRPSHAALEGYCNAEPHLRTQLWRRLVKQGPHERPEDSCRPCSGTYPFCDCESLAPPGSQEAAEAAAQHAAEMAAEDATEKERELAEQAAQQERDSAEESMEKASNADVTGQDDAYAQMEQKKRADMLKRVRSAEDAARRGEEQSDTAKRLAETA